MSNSQRGDDGLPREYRGNQSDADLPIEAERSDDRFDSASDCARQTVGDLRRMAVGIGKIERAPQQHTYQQDDGTRANQKHLGAV